MRSWNWEPLGLGSSSYCVSQRSIWVNDYCRFHANIKALLHLRNMGSSCAKVFWLFLVFQTVFSVLINTLNSIMTLETAEHPKMQFQTENFILWLFLEFQKQCPHKNPYAVFDITWILVNFALGFLWSNLGYCKLIEGFDFLAWYK